MNFPQGPRVEGKDGKTQITIVGEGIGICQVHKLKYDAELCILTEYQFFLLYLLQAALSLC